MFAWLTENLINIVLCAVLLLVVGGIVIRMIRDKRAGKSSCGCGCDGCSGCNACSASLKNRRTN